MEWKADPALGVVPKVGDPAGDTDPADDTVGAPPPPPPPAPVGLLPDPNPGLGG